MDNRIFEALLNDFKEFMLNRDDVCKYCKHHQPCQGKNVVSILKAKKLGTIAAANTIGNGIVQILILETVLFWKTHRVTAA